MYGNIEAPKQSNQLLLILVYKVHFCEQDVDWYLATNLVILKYIYCKKIFKFTS